MKVMKKLPVMLVTALLLIEYIIANTTNTASSTSTTTTTAPSGAKPAASGHGPLDYSEVNWSDTCKYGRRNSPIDIPDFTSEVFINSTDYLKIISSNYSLIGNTSWTQYHEYKFMMPIPSYVGDLYVYKNETKYKYTLSDIHMHVVSEHTIKEQTFDMELHMVHKKDTDWLAAQGVTNDPDAQQTHLVIGTLFKASGNVPHPLIETFNFPSNKIDGLDLNSLADRNKNFFHYLGGLTTPPCAEVVNWVLMEKIEIMSLDQFKKIDDWVRELYPKPHGDARMPKALNGRTIYYSDNFTGSQMNFSMIIVAMAAMFIVFFFRKKFDIV